MVEGKERARGKVRKERERGREVVQSLHFNQTVQSGILTHQVCGK